MLVNCIVQKEFDIVDFIKWLKTQSSEYKDYFEAFDYQLIDKYMTNKYKDVSCVEELDIDFIILTIQDALNSSI